MITSLLTKRTLPASPLVPWEYNSRRCTRSPAGVVSTGIKFNSSSNGLPVGLLRETWTWRDHFTGIPLLAPLESQIQPTRLIEAWRNRHFGLSHLEGKTPPSISPLKGSTSPPHFFFKRYTSLREKHANISITKHPYEPTWQIPLEVRVMGLRLTISRHSSLREIPSQMSLDHCAQPVQEHPHQR